MRATCRSTSTGPYARFDVQITDAVGVYGQFESREYNETLLPIADYSADRYGLFLRWSSK